MSQICLESKLVLSLVVSQKAFRTYDSNRLPAKAAEVSHPRLQETAYCQDA